MPPHKQKSQSVLGNKDINNKINNNNFEDFKQNFANTNIGFNINMENIGKKNDLDNNIEKNELNINDLIIEDIKEDK